MRYNGNMNYSKCNGCRYFKNGKCTKPQSAAAQPIETAAELHKDRTAMSYDVSDELILQEFLKINDEERPGRSKKELIAVSPDVTSDVQVTAVKPSEPDKDVSATPVWTQLRGIQMQLAGFPGGTLEGGSAIEFDAVINSQSPQIDYDHTAGEFTLLENGNYLVLWWVALNGSAEMPPAFAVKVNGNTQATGSGSLIAGQLSGTALITVSETPTILSLINSGEDAVTLSEGPVQANILIVHVTF
jgi:hypothetical protein